jgi:hypothetical protein
MAKSQVDIVDGKLILSCPNAVKPTVWQMDLASVKASALEVIPDEKTDNYSVMLKAASGDSVTIVSFSSEKAALDTLLKTAKAMQNAHGKIGGIPNLSNTSGKSNSSWNGAFKAFGFLVLGGIATIAILMGISFMIQNPTSKGAFKTNGTNAPTAAEQNGVPLSADDFLRRR